MPLQKPRPPILVGGSSEGALRRVARFGDGWHATSSTHDAFRQGAETVAKFWKEAGRDGAPDLSLRIPIAIDGVHRPAVDMSLLGSRYVVRGSPAKVVDELHAFRELGCGHVALEVSYSTFPAIMKTIDVLASQVKPKLAG